MLHIIIKNKSNIDTFEGTSYEVGKKIGSAYKDSIVSCAKQLHKDYPFSKKEYERLTDISSKKLQEKYPHMFEEMLGISNGCGLPFSFFYVNSIYEDARDNINNYYRGDLGCTDIYATGDKTEDGLTLVGHNNDQSIYPYDIKTYRVKVKGKPEALYVSCDGSVPSVGANEIGLVMVGNQLNSTDTKHGIPRILIAKNLLYATSIEEAIKMCNDKDRSSSYNNVIIDKRGRLISFEGTAKEYSILKPKDNLYVHTNHYVTDRLKKYEFTLTPSSTFTRLKTANKMLQEVNKHTINTFKNILSDHSNDPNYICRHKSSGTKTYFSAIFQPEKKTMHLCIGNPCESKFKIIKY